MRLVLATLLLLRAAEPALLWHPLRLSLPGLDAPPTLAYTGRVVDWSTGRPIAGARVWPGNDPEAFAITDARGVYRLAGTPAVPVRLWVRAEDHLPFRRMFHPPSPWIVSPKAPTLAVWPARMLTGSVMRPDGRPVPGAEVRVFGGNPQEVEELAKTFSSEQGRFELAVIHDGDYEVIATAPGLAPASENLTLGEGQAGLPGIRLVLRPGRTASGRVVDEHGQPLAEVRVALTRNTDDRLWPRRPADDSLYQATTDHDGRFEIPGLPAGWFDLEASRPGFLPERFQALEVEGGSDGVNLGTMTLRRPATVTGRVIGSKGEPLADVRVLLKSGGEVGVEVASGPDGRFELTAPDPRKPFEIEACRPDRLSLFYPYETLPDGPVELTLPPAARLTGQVVDPDREPAAGASVTASVDPDQLWPIPPSLFSCPRVAEARATTDTEGRFVLGPLPVARLYVWATMKTYIGSDVEILTLDEEQLEAEVPALALGRASVVSGRVLKADGSPAPHALVSMEGRNGYRFEKYEWTDGDGRYRIEGLPAGEQTVEARHDALGWSRRDVEIAPGENQLDITLESHEPRLARGRVVDPDGVPVAGALVEQGVETVYTDARGGFAIRVEEDGYELVARKDGYAPAYLSHWAAGGAREGLELRLGREASVSGRLLGFDPPDLDEARVSAIFLKFSEMQIPGRISSDGTYHLQGLSPGEWLITADLGGRSAGATVTISPEEPEVELDLSFPNRTQVQGRVVDADGQPVEGADVRLVGPEEEHQAVTESDGSFSLEVEEGTYEILAMHRDHALTHSGVITVSGEAVEGLEIRLEQPTVLTGRLLGLSADDLGEIQVRIELGAVESRATLEVDERSGEPPVYTFDDLGPGEWTVRARVNAEEVVRKVTVRPGGKTVEMDLPFSFGDLTLSGRVTGYRTIPSGGVAWLRKADSGQSAWILGISEGSFEFNRLLPGRYVLDLFDDRNKPVLQKEIDLTASQELEIDLGDVAEEVR